MRQARSLSGPLAPKIGPAEGCDVTGGHPPARFIRYHRCHPAPPMSSPMSTREANMCCSLAGQLQQNFKIDTF
jgi:hypothetical protein